MNKESFAGCAGAVGLSVIAVVGLSLLMAIPTYYLWNWLMPYLFHLPVVNFWQALGINFLAAILFKPSYSSNKKD